MKTNLITGIIAVSLACAASAYGGDFYVSPAGTPSGAGTMGDPWDLETALHHPPLLQPGDTIWVRGGTYVGAHTSLLAGTDGAPITVRAYRRERVILDYASNANCDPGSPSECSPSNKRCNALTIPSCSHDVVLRDLEFTNSAVAPRVSLPVGGCDEAPECCYVDGMAPPLEPECGEAPTGISRAQWHPLHIAGDRVQVVNVAVHDGGVGITADQQALDTEIYGSLVFSNGWLDPTTGRGAGLHVENASPSWRPSTKSVRNTLIWNNFGDGYRSITTWGRFGHDLHLEEVVAFNNGEPAAAFYATDPIAYESLQNVRYGNVMLQADEIMRQVHLDRCRLYHPSTSAVQRQHFGGIKDANYEFHKDLIIDDSYLSSTGTPLSLIRWQRVRTTGTTIVGGATSAVGDGEALVEMEKTECATLWAPAAPWNALEMEDNAYYFTGEGSTPFGIRTGAPWIYRNFADWRTAIYGRDANSSYSTGAPVTNAVFVQPNAYEAGRAHVVVYNWEGLDSVSVDLSSIGLVDGDQFRIYNVQGFQNTGGADYFGTIVGEGTYLSTSPVFDIDMTDPSATAPIGLGHAVASTLPEFGAFLVRKLPCGDGHVDAGEACDDSNAVDGDGCDTNCTASTCGNGIPAGAEQCDDGNSDDGDTCKSDCTLNVCGDGFEQTGVEECDDGNAVEGDGCDPNCTPTACGNGVATSGEACDDGNAVDGDGCDSNCTATACGNGVATSGEACDDGNAVDGDGCDSNCSATACGNGIPTAGEACDDGNAIEGDGCDTNCTGTACGNGIETAGEGCDDGNGVDGDGCDTNCTATACGNGIATAGEACDDGNAIEGDGCDTNCTATACGNGIPSDTEQCDDGNADESDACKSDCTFNVCGDGIVETGVEACDDGNAVDGDGCDTNCTATACGNGIPTAGEECDDGNASDGDGCDTNCTATACGNGIATAPEECDDGNAVEGDGCDTNCTTTACGNGIPAAGETCDDGNAVDGDGCDVNCTLTGCGNAITTAGEVCDDGNLASGDGCDATCKPTGCGSGVRTGAEACDDGNAVEGDGCDSNCTYSAVVETVAGGATVTTDALALGATEQIPVQVSIATPNGGTVEIDTPATPEMPTGFAVLGIPLDISAPPASTVEPLTIVFEVDISLIPADVEPDRLDITRNGALVADCSGAPGTASPDPCVASRVVETDGDVKITVLTSQASQWAIVLRSLFDDERACVNAVAKAGLKVAKTQAKANAACVKGAARGDEANPQACLAADATQKVAKAVAKLAATELVKCPSSPPFAIADATTVGAAAKAEEIGMVADLFGAALSGVLLPSSNPGARCQSDALKNTQKVLEAQAKALLKCVKYGMAGKPAPMFTPGDVEGCLAVVAADEKGKVAKSVAKLGATLGPCAAALATVLPGGCGAAAAPSECLAERVSCRVCRIANSTFQLSANCDQYDDGQDDGSCP